MPLKSDNHYMRQAFALAKKGAGLVSPNPQVGAIVVKGDEIVGRGYHKRYKAEHAEPQAIKEAGARAKNATLYVNLEPCTHFGHNPPCTNAIINAGIKRVVYCNKDSNPIVASNPAENILAVHKIEVVSGVLEEEGRLLNEKYFISKQNSLPFVTLKLAQTLDGKIADRDGNSKWITNEKSRKYSHQLRFEHDAIMVGIGTLRKDNSSLSIRDFHKKKPVTAVVLDANLEISPEFAVISSAEKVFVVTVREKESVFYHHFGKKFSHVKPIFVNKNHEHLCEKEALESLYSLGIQSVLVEGGGSVAGSFMHRQLVDRVMLFFAPKIILDTFALSGFNKGDFKMLKDCQNLILDRIKQFDNDVLLSYRLDKTGIKYNGE